MKPTKGQQATGVVIVEEKPLTKDESSRLAVLEKSIEENFIGFVVVGNALAEINEKRLYRTEEGRTFEDYCREIWEMARCRAYQLISAASAVENVYNCRHFESTEIEFVPPKNEAQARELARLSPDDQVLAWRNVLEQASINKGKVTAGKVRKAVSKIRGEKLGRAVKEAIRLEATKKTEGEEKKPQISEEFAAAWTALWQQVEKERRANWRHTSKAVVYERLLLLLENFKETDAEPQSFAGAL